MNINMEFFKKISKQLGCKYILFECSAKNGKNTENIFVGLRRIYYKKFKIFECGICFYSLIF